MKSILKIVLPCLLIIAYYTACTTDSHDVSSTDTLPYYGHHDSINGEVKHYQVPEFSFIDQDSQVVNNATVAGKVYVVDFFFTSCKTICPVVKSNMIKIYDHFKNDDRVLLISHSIDTKHDTVGRLKRYAEQLEVPSGKWHFVTGEKDHIYEMADAYFIAAQEDPGAPGGFDHSGRLILVDKNGHIRGNAEGTDAADVTKFLSTIEQLLNESD